MDRTWEKRLGKRNTERTPVKKGPNIGKIFDWYTCDGVVACFPDQWAEDGPLGPKMNGLEEIPVEIQDIHYVGKLDTDSEE